MEENEMGAYLWDTIGVAGVTVPSPVARRIAIKD